VHNVFATLATKEVKAYISNIKSVALEFEQTDNRGNKASGMLIIDKPYKFRCNYYAPFPLLIIGNKNYVSVYDYEMEHLSRIKANENIFYFLLVDQINFDQEFDIISAKEQNNKYIIKLNHPDLNRESQIEFDKVTKQLISLKIFEDNNIITVDFIKTQKIRDVAGSLFIIQDPDIFGLPERLDKVKLEKKYKIAN